MLLILLVFFALWALISTGMLIRNPLPFPDIGHRLFAVPDEKARRTVMRLFALAGLRGRMRFQIGPSNQTVLWDNVTTIHVLDPGSGQSGNGVSLVVGNPEQAAQQAIKILTAAGYTAERLRPGSVSGLPPTDLIVLASDAFRGWALGFRRHQLRLPKPTFLPVE